MNNIEVCIDALPTIAKRLQSINDDLEAVGSNVPPTPDAGDMSGAISSILCQLVAVAGQVSEGSAAAADAVREGGSAYTRTDDFSGQLFAPQFGAR